MACGDQVVGYFSLASGSINLVKATGGFRRNMPDPIAVMLPARLAMDRRLQGRGRGKALQAEAAKRVLAAGGIGVRGRVVQALNEAAATFYSSLGFEASTVSPARPASPWSACT